METQVASFNVSKSEAQLIQKIAARAVKEAKSVGIQYDFLDADMDITACHANGSPLDLEKLLSADDFNFNHDVFGIRRHLDRITGKLNDHFSPRCARASGHYTGDDRDQT